MGHLPKKTLEDLEFFRVTDQITDFAITPMGKSACKALVPLPDQETLFKELHAVSEYLASFANDNRIPNHGFEDLSPAFQLLKIENSVLENIKHANPQSIFHQISQADYFPGFGHYRFFYPSV